MAAWEMIVLWPWLYQPKKGKLITQYCKEGNKGGNVPLTIQKGDQELYDLKILEGQIW